MTEWQSVTSRETAQQQCLKTFVGPLIPTRMTAPRSPRVGQRNIHEFLRVSLKEFMNTVSFILKKATFNDLFVNSFIINEHSCLLLFRLVVARALARRPRTN